MGHVGPEAVVRPGEQELAGGNLILLLNYAGFSISNSVSEPRPALSSPA